MFCMQILIRNTVHSTIENFRNFRVVNFSKIGMKYDFHASFVNVSLK